MKIQVQDYREFLGSIVIPEHQLQERVKQLARAIDSDYAEKSPLLIGILRGCVIFLSDLTRYMTIPHQVEFLAVESYGPGRREPGALKFYLELRTPIKGRHVILVEDIVDTGQTIAQVLEYLKQMEPASIQVCTLLHKDKERPYHIPLRYVGFHIPNVFVFGYGLDMDGYWRNLPFIAVPDLEKYHPPQMLSE